MIQLPNIITLLRSPFYTVIPIAIVTAVATFAAIHERIYIKKTHPSFPPLSHGATGRES